MSTVVVVGEFDGMHLGHAALVGAAVTVAERQRRPLVAVVLDAATTPVLMPTVERCRALVAAGAHAAHVVRLGERRGFDLVDQIRERLRPSTAVLACTPGRVPDRPHLRTAFEQRGVDVVEVDRVRRGRSVVSSRWVREDVTEGRVASAEEMLGRPFALTGLVERGEHLGRTIGFPTANLAIPDGVVIPRRGVYAGAARMGGTSRPAAVNIGTRPTVTDAGRCVVEAHLLDFDGDLYDRHLTIELVARLRDERRFDGLDALVAQLHRDVHAVRALARND